MNRTYLDANAIIYLLEGNEPFHSLIVSKLTSQMQSSEDVLLTSRLSRLECRVLPLKNGNSQLLQIYEDFFSKDQLILAELTGPVVDRACELRVKYGFKTPDAIHLATAMEFGASQFLTGDARLKKCTELQVDVLTEQT